MKTPASAEDRARIAARYPRRSLTDVLVFLVACAALVASVGIVAAAGLVRSNPPVVAMIRAFDVKTPDLTTAEVVVQRQDPGQRATCFVYAQATNYERVGELDLEIPPGTEELTVMQVDVRTVREATSVSLENCRIAA